ncbi:signal peptidase I [Asticcacaulis sp. AC402]|uniref:signal peptidase I n=1 Tax=Asticcacaulis sp. AC402 TaxID=1282361 RepID=UPI0003C407C7|nr:signal peptidase I [Asticcacaulis sp. AC402]ESQ76310.1 signal peptidase I [Asticcacaulis sp. AC402]
MNKDENITPEPADQTIAAAAAPAVDDAQPQSELTAAVEAESEAVEADTRTAQEIAIAEIKEIASVVGVAILLVVFLRTLLFQPFTIPSASMEPNLYKGDYIIVSKWDYGYSKHSLPISLPLFDGRLFNTVPKRGDIVVFKLPVDNKTDYIKRVVGLPGDTVQMTNDQLYINGQAVKTTTLGAIAGTAPGSSIYRDGTGTLQREELPDGRTHLMQDFVQDGSVDNTDLYTVPEGHYFMMGDNRDNSQDSRYPMSVGGVDFVPAENLEGRAVLVLMSWKDGSSLWKPWTWLNFHWDRFFKSLH